MSSAAFPDGGDPERIDNRGVDTALAPETREQPVGVFEPGEHVAVGLDLYRVVAQQCRASMLRRVADGAELRLSGDTPVSGVFVSTP